jgi:zinc/manganese transport system permease protein
MFHSIMGLYHFQFIQNALLSGVFIAVACAVVGYFLIGGGYTFAGHALPNIGFAGAAGAVFLGVKPVYGLFAMTILAGAAMGAGGREVRERDVSIGVVMSFALGLGLMFLSLYGGYGERVYSILFGTVLGITRNDVIFTGLMGLGAVCLVLFLFRPLLFVMFDPLAAEAKGVPAGLLTMVFLVVVAVTVSLAVQVVGALLVFTMLVGPGATANRLTHRPCRAILLAALLGVAYMFAGITLAGLSGDWPVSFFIATISFLVYMPVRIFFRGKGGRAPVSCREVQGHMQRCFLNSREECKKRAAQC